MTKEMIIQVLEILLAEGHIKESDLLPFVKDGIKFWLKTK